MLVQEFKKGESLSGWHVLVHTYGEYEEDMCEFKPFETNLDSKKQMENNEDSKMQMDTGSNRKMKPKEWSTITEKQWCNTGFKTNKRN